MGSDVRGMSAIEMQRRMFMEYRLRDQPPQGTLYGLGQSQGLLGGLAGQTLAQDQCAYLRQDIQAQRPYVKVTDKCKNPDKEEFTHEINYDNSLEGELKKWRKGWLE